MARLRSLRPALSPAALGASLAVGATAFLSSATMAQQAGEPAPAGTVQELPPVAVEAQTNPANTLRGTTGIGRMPGTIQDTPQSVNVVTPELMRQQGTQTLDQALRNVPGITAGIGEGNGGFNGDQFRIRGLDAKGDVYVDGLRDFGVYTRDSFNMESVEVFKGPSSTNFGMGTVGGAINSTQKSPVFSDNFRSGTVAGGNGSTGRGTMDVNQSVNDNVAMRLNVMGHHSEAVGRENVESSRWGVAPSLALKLGETTNLSLMYLYQYDNRVPDFGVPLITAPGDSNAKPITEHGVDRIKWYGTDSDQDITRTNMLTSRFSHLMDDWLTFYNDTRFAYYDRDMQGSIPTCGADCVEDFFTPGALAEFTYGAGGGPNYRQDTWGVQNVASAVGNAVTNGFRQQFVVGLDVFHQDDDRKYGTIVGTKAGSNVRNPDHSDDDFHVTSGGQKREGNATNVGVFVSNRFWINDQLSILGGLRIDQYWAEYRTATADGVSDHSDTDSSQLNPKISLIWEPVPEQTYYVSYATSSQPPGMLITNSANPINDATSDLQPEQNTNVEIGAKLSLFNNKLGISGSIFQVDKDRVTETEPDGTIIASSASEQRVRGFELGVTGEVYEGLTLSAAYTYLDAEITDATVADNAGNEVPQAPKNSFAFWTNYDLSTVMDTGPGRLEVGGGATYREAMYVNDTNTARVPFNLSWDARVAYELENVSFAVNGYNLADRLNYDQTWTNRVVPGQGRTVLLTVGFNF